MASHRSLHRRLAGWLAAVMLLMQIAVAAYACPSSTRTGAADEADAMAGMPCADMMAAGATLDEQQPGLCQQHCQFGTTQQAWEPAQALQLPAAALLPSVVVPAVAAAPRRDAATWASSARQRERTPPPPHSILHCCYRI